MRNIVIIFVLFCVSLAPEALRANDLAKVMQKASELNIRRLKYFEGGVYGKIDGSVYYITTLAKAPNIDRLYLLMMKMLSKTYGCFLKKRIKSAGEYHFFCRDSRMVTMSPVFGQKLVLFRAVQKDRYGNVLLVEDQPWQRTSH